MTSPARIRVLIVDDSAFARKVIREVLSKDPEIDVVGIARDGLEALEKIAELRPDVLTLDLLMPDLDGLGLLRALPKENSPRVVIVSVSGSDTDIALEALELGAVDLVTKPTPLATSRLYEISSELPQKIKAAAKATPRSHAKEVPSAEAKKPLALAETMIPTVRLVAVGTSTGGPQALTHLFKTLPAGLPVPLVVALHIPAGYTEPLATRLSQLGGMTVVEAYDGMELLAGHAALAPGGMHLRVKARNGRLYASVSREPLNSLHHPSVDVLFESVAEAVGRDSLALVMTGMGEDGLRGARELKGRGGSVLAESASSCVVYGMPRSIIEGGLASAEAPLEKLPSLLLSYIFGNQSTI